MHKNLLPLALLGAILPAQQDEGIMPSWEVASIAQDLGVQVDQVEQILGGIHPEEWAQAGVAYAGQQSPSA